LSDKKPDDELRLLLIKAINESDSFEDRFDAEVWLVDMSARLKSRIPDTNNRLHILKNIHYEATRANLFPELVLAVIDVESNFNRYAISKAGAMGLMQIMPFWLKEIGKPGDNLFNIKTNLRMGCTILRYYLDKEKGDLTQALARYNGSKGSYKYTNKVFRFLDNRWRKR
ncbi:MAG: lytic transglycosylase domain-containing protein, partial [Gammaproteobacteria bacterium]|nr:lytic transglycosylase domain-containing protein [Gammaproteobacteria bacterium]